MSIRGKHLFYRALALTVLSGLTLIGAGLNSQYRERSAEFDRLAATLFRSLARHDAILPLLHDSRHFMQVRQNYPEIVRIEPSSSDAPSADTLTVENNGRYWLNVPRRDLRILVDSRQLIESLAATDAFSYLALHRGQQLLWQSAGQQGGIWRWQREFRSVSHHFVFTARAGPQWRRLPWPLIALLLPLWAALLSGTSLLYGYYRQRKIDALRARFYELSRPDAINEATGAMMHELNQPLTALNSYLHSAFLLHQQRQYHPVREALQASQLQVQRITGLLKHYQQHLHPAGVTWQNVNIADVWRRVEMLLENELRSASVSVAVDFNPGLPEIFSVPLWLEQIFHNLLSNAIQVQLTAGSGWVSVSATREGEMLKIVMVDGGPGLSPEAIQLIFRPFYTTRKQGMGLGMTLTHTLIARCNGRIEASNGAQGGACFTLWLPVKESDDDRLAD